MDDWTLLDQVKRETVFRNGANVGTRYWVLAKCRCGVEKRVRCTKIGSIYSESCGCAQKESQARTHTTHGASKTRLYKIYEGLFDRCYNSKDTNYLNYGGRGIWVVKSWHTFEPFRDWSLNNGYRDDLQLDRQNNDGPYSPKNCRWVTGKQNMRNTRKTVWLVAFGERKSLPDWAEDARCSVGRRTLETRLRYEWDPETAMITPLHSRPYGRMTNGSYRVPDTVKRVNR
jgi:hypothetical protein